MITTPKTKSARSAELLQGPPSPKLLPPELTYIRDFSELDIGDIQSVGGKNAGLGELTQQLVPEGIRVPEGFAITADAFRLFLHQAGIAETIYTRLDRLDIGDIEDLHHAGVMIRRMIESQPLPDELVREIEYAYECLGSAEPISVAVRSSATAEDLPGASFAGQQETFLNVHGIQMLLETCRRCFASLFTDRAIAYRVQQGYAHRQVALSIGVQRMVRSDLGASGVLFTIDTESGFRDAVLINAAFGLGENVVKGTVSPDEYIAFKPTLLTAQCPILKKAVGSKEFRMVCDPDSLRLVKNVPLSPNERKQLVLADTEILQLARWACQIEDHYSRRNGHPTPMDIEWAKDGQTAELFILQARPETVHSRRNPHLIQTYTLDANSAPVLVRGRSVGSKIASGAVHVIHSTSALSSFRAGEILVTEKTDPDWEPIMKKAAAIVTDHGGRTCHAAIVSRELGIPAIVGTENATTTLRNGQPVTVSCAEGDIGHVLEGMVPFRVDETDVSDLPRPRTKVMMNLGNPEEAFACSMIPNDGVGLAREEFIISNYIGVHPLALLEFGQLTDPKLREQIEELTTGYEDKARFFVEKLAEGAGTIAAAFYPKDVILRLSDFKTNEYADLIGGRAFEPQEENPMLGFRGASRYYHPRYQAAFALECQAIRRVREEMGLTNLKVMVPFCRTPDEGRKVQQVMAEHGLVRGENGLEIYVMCEIPSNVILAEIFTQAFDGFSIGSNDLTQLVLGVDRDSEIVAPIFDERDEAVTRMISQVIHACKSLGCKIGICGQAPSDYPEFVEFLVEEGIDSISLTPDTILKTTKVILEKERACAEWQAGIPDLV